MHRSFLAAMIAACAFVVASPAQAALVAPTIAVPTIQINSLQHTYTPARPPLLTSRARDGVTIGDGNYTGGGAFSIPSIATGDVFSIRIQAPAGKKFVVHEDATFFGFSF